MGLPKQGGKIFPYFGNAIAENVREKKKKKNCGNGIAEIDDFFIFGNCGNGIAEIGEFFFFFE